MTLIIKLFGMLMLLAGISLLVKPGIVFGFIEHNMGSTSLYVFAIAVRLVLGLLFLFAARESKYPRVIKIFGYLFVVAALILVFIGEESFQDFIAPLISDVRPFAPLAGLLAMVVGGFLIFAFSSNRKLDLK